MKSNFSQFLFIIVCVCIRLRSRSVGFSLVFVFGSSSLGDALCCKPCNFAQLLRFFLIKIYFLKNKNKTKQKENLRREILQNETGFKSPLMSSFFFVSLHTHAFLFYLFLLLFKSSHLIILFLLLVFSNNLLDCIGALHELGNKKSVRVVNMRIKSAAKAHLLAQTISFWGETNKSGNSLER